MSSPITITVWSDYVCPWCYVGTSELKSLSGSFDFVVDWRPFLLRPDAPEEGWPLPDRIKAFNAQPNNPLSARAQKLGITLKQRDQVPNSRRAHEATEFARANGKLQAFHDGLIERYWSHGDDLHDWEVLSQVATASGLDPAKMRSEVEAGQWKAAMNEGLQAATEIGISGVPTFIIGQKYAVQGAQDASVFKEIFGKLMAA